LPPAPGKLTRERSQKKVGEAAGPSALTSQNL
jgi:hypothetical protein